MKKKIVYLTRLDPYDILSWSGLPYFILKTLKKSYDVITVGPLSDRVRIIYIFKRFFFSLFKIKFDIDRPIVVAKDFAKQIEKKLHNQNYDFIITNEPYLVTFLKTKKPIFIYTDFLFSTLYRNYYSGIKIHKNNLQEANYCEKIALNKSSKIFLTSYYAINHGSKYYKIKKNKFSYLPFGANLKKIPKKKKIYSIIKKKKLNVCNLITIGVHWERKGMDFAVKLTKKINELGLKAQLYIIGSKPNKQQTLSKNIKVIRFLDKNITLDSKIYSNFLKKAHFNLLFSRSEAFGLVNIEASAYGLYSITNDVGGISGAVINNLNGYRFRDIRNINLIAKYIFKIFKNREEFNNKSFNSRKAYDKKFNWDVIGKTLFRSIK
jgi:glycosyltransferase involved in cell wall biosynthesis